MFDSPTTAADHTLPFTTRYRPLRISSTMSQSLAGTQESDHDQAQLVRSDGEFHISFPENYPQQTTSTLETVPSLSVYNSRGEEGGEGGERGSETEGPERSITIGDRVLSTGSDFEFRGGKGLGPGEAVEGRIEEAEERPAGIDDGVESLPLFLATGLGIGISGTGAIPAEDWSGGGGSDEENQYRRLVEEQPCNAVYLRNYAWFLHQTKQDLIKAEEYYSRAILVKPDYGEALCQYAMLIWEGHHDYERALSYFEQASQVAPNDSEVLAAYAHFLWIAEDTDEGEDLSLGLPTSHGEIASASAA